MMAENIPAFPSFDVDGEPTSVGPRWRKWALRFENMLIALNITDARRKKALLLHLAGERVHEIADTLNIVTAADGDVYDDTKKALSSYFEPSKNTRYETYVFRQAKQREGETLDQYHMRIRGLAKNCDFADVDAEIYSQIVQSCLSANLRRRALRDTSMTLNGLLTLARNVDLAELQASEIENKAQSAATDVNSIKVQQKVGSRNKGQGQGRQGQTSGQTCYQCGGKYPHKGGQSSCPAAGQSCNTCGGKGHFARCCKTREPRTCRQTHRSKQQSSGERSHFAGSTKSHVHNVVMPTAECGKPSGTCQADKCDVDGHVVPHDPDYDDYVFALDNDRPAQQPKVQLEIAGTVVTFIIDSGAAVNMLDIKTYSCLKVKPMLEASNSEIFAYGSKIPLELAGKFTATIASLSRASKTEAVFYVAARCHGSLLSFDTAHKLSLISISVNMTDSFKGTVMHRFPDLFNGKIGKLKNMKLKLHINPDVEPVAQKCRKTPFHMRSKIEAEINKLLENDIIEETSGPTPWVSGIVAVPKPHSDGEIRLCTDMRCANKAILRERHPMPTIDDVLFAINGSTVFSKIDIRSAYHQIELAEESRYVTTFVTHMGLFRYKRLNFGINSASEKFQQVIAKLIAGIPGVLNVSDDILISGKTEKNHDDSLYMLLQRLNDNGITLGVEKCVFKEKSLPFCGHVLSADGVSAQAAKIRAITALRPPGNVTELKSLLGMANYCARFIPGYSALVQPMLSLLRKNADWQWGSAQQASFEELKTALSANRVLGYFDPRNRTEVAVDAGPASLGAILLQYKPDGTKYTVAYASRALTDTERRYSQIEREALAAVWACEHFHAYIYGSEFDLVTDNKPLEMLLRNPHSHLPVRLERWSLRLQPYSFQVKHISGVLNPADYLSRYVINDTASDDDTEAYVNFTIDLSVPKAMTLDEIRQHSVKDATLNVVRQHIALNSWPPAKDISDQVRPFFNIRDELSVAADDVVILRGPVIVLPTTLRDKAVRTAHEGHQGIAKTKTLLRTKVWFPRLNQMVEQLVAHCTACQLSTVSAKPVPCQSSPLPSAPWSEVSLDFHGPLPTGEYLLVLMDDYSRFPVVEIISSVSSNTVLPCLDKIFALLGVPEVLKTDNGPPFNGTQFAQFAAYLGFRHRRITPLWPQANGEVERFMRTLGKAMLTAIAEHKNWKQELFTFLRSYRATPHTSTKTPPGDLLFSAGFRTRFPVMSKHPAANQSVVINDVDAKRQSKEYADNRRHAQSHTFSIGDNVYVRQRKKNKLSLPYDPSPFTITQIKGSMITAERVDKRITRNAWFFTHATSAQPAQPVVSDTEYSEPDVVLPTPQLPHNDNANAGRQSPDRHPPVVVDERPPARRYPQRTNRGQRPLHLRDFIIDT
jgi:transposase InsO family protein